MRGNSSIKPSIWLRTLDPISRIIALPWALAYLNYCLDESWSKVIAAYGFQSSALTIGRLIGKNWISDAKQSKNATFILSNCLILAFSFVLSALTTRFSVLFVCNFLIGLSGSCFSSSSRSVTTLTSCQISWANSNKNEYHSHLYSTTLAFIPLLSGLFYSSSKSARFPSILPSFLFAFLCLLLSIPHIFYESRPSRKKSIPLEGMGGGGGRGGWDTSSNDSAFDNSARKRNSHAYVNSFQSDPEDIALSSEQQVPSSYMKMYGNNKPAAYKAYLKTLRWRREHGMDSILNGRQPQPSFDDILRCYPHAIHGVSRDGCVVVYELLGKAKLKDLLNAGVTVEDMVFHFTFRNEFVFQCLGHLVPPPYTADPEVKLMTVVDVQGVRLSDLKTEVISFIKQSSDVVDSHYPGRVVRLVICNTPVWFSSMWTMISRVLPDHVKKKIRIISSATGSPGLDEFIAPEYRPPEYGGTSVPLGQRPEHLRFVRIGRGQSSGGVAQSGGAQGDEARAVSSHESPVGDGAVNRPTVHRSSSQEQLSSLDVHQQGEGHGYNLNHADRTVGSVAGTVTSSHDPGLVESEGSRGWFGWSVLKGLGIGGRTAYLGSKNSYKYDPSLGIWTLTPDLERTEAEGAPESTPVERSSSAEMTQQQLEEHGLVLAIQAAHMAALDSRGKDWEGRSPRGWEGSSSGKISGAPVRIDILPRGHPSTTARSSAYGSTIQEDIDEEEEEMDDQHVAVYQGSSESRNNVSSSPRSQSGQIRPAPRRDKISADVLLLVVWAHLVSSSIQSVIYSLLPVWLASPPKLGGLGYSPLDLGLVLGAAGILLRVGSPLGFKKKLDFLLVASPARALRIGCGAVSICCAALPLLLSRGVAQSSWADNTYNYHLEEGILNSRSPDNPLVSVTALHTLAGIPSQSFRALFVPALLLAVLGCSTELARRASSLLLHVALSPSVVAPDTLLVALEGLADTLAPVLTALLCSSVLKLRLAYPLDASLPLVLVAVLGTLLYLSTFLLQVKFRGDFGVITEQSIAARKARGGSSGFSTHGFFDLLRVPVADIGHLLSPVGAGHEATLLNFKRDLKDV